MVASGGWGYHGPGPGPTTLQPWREKTFTQMITRDKEQKHLQCSERSEGDGTSPTRCCLNKKLRQGRTQVFPARGGTSFRWFLLVILLVAGLSSRAEAACPGVNCPSGCQCTDVSGSCRVDCSTSGVALSTLSSTITAHDRVSELILQDCSISTVSHDAFQQYTNLVKLDLMDNDIVSLDKDVFQPLTNLEVLLLPGNIINTLPLNIFAGRRKLRELSLSNNDLSNIDANLFNDLDRLEVLYLDNNVFQFLPLALFERRSHLTKVDLSENPWTCDCLLGGLMSWARARQAEGKLVNSGSTRCTAPPSNTNTVWDRLDLSMLACDLSALVSCFQDHGVSHAIFPEDRVLSASSSLSDCGRECSRLGRPYGVFHENVVCLCADSAKTTAPSCSCPSGDEPESGSSMCSRTYFQGAFGVFLGSALGPTQPISSLSNAELSFDGKNGFPVVWDLGDGSGEVSRAANAGALSYNYLMAGTYNVSVRLRDEVTLEWPQTVLDPVGAARLVAPSFSDAQKDLDIELQLGRGSKVDVRWSRYNANGNKVLGKRCSYGWSQHNVHWCIKSTAVPGANPVNLTTADEGCKEQDAKLLTFTSYSEMNGLIRLLSKELSGGKVLLTDAVRLDNVTYEWRAINRKPHFNTSMVTDPLNGDCLGLSQTGLVGMECSQVNNYVCRKVQVFCEFGGEEWNQRTCFVPLGEDQPLAQPEAQRACEAITGNLATVDSAQKDDFIRRQVLNNFGSYRLWLGLQDHHVPSYYLWPSGGSLGSHAPWRAGMPLPSSPGSNLCVVMDTNTTTWSSVACDQKMMYLCEYTSGERIEQVQTFLSGTGKLTSGPVTHLTATVEQVNNLTDLIIIPGHWFPHKGGVQTWRFQANTPSASETKFRLQVYRPVCEEGYFRVPPGCSNLPSPFATCSDVPVSCSNSPPSCSPGYQFCPLIKKCLSILSPCNCLALKSLNTEGCDGQQYSSNGGQLTSSTLGSNAFRFDGTVPKYTLIGQTSVSLQPGESGLFNVEADDIQVEPNDVIGVQFISGSQEVLCEPTTADMPLRNWSQSILVSSVPKNAMMEKVNVNGGIWLDSMVCNIQAVSSTPFSVTPPKNLIDKSVHTAADYKYRATVLSPLSENAFTYETTVTMQFSVKGLALIYPPPDWPKRTADAKNLAAVEAQTTHDFLWYIKIGTDVMANWTLPDGSPAFTSACPSSLRSKVPTCSKSGQFLHHRMSTGAPGNLSTITVNVWNMVSEAKLTTDILAQERVKKLKLLTPPVAEFVNGQPTSITTNKEKGSDVKYEWDFGDGKEAVTTQGSTTHLYRAPGIFDITVKGSNYLNFESVTEKVKLFKRANVRNLVISAPTEVDMESTFSLTLSMKLVIGSSVTIQIYYGNGQSASITEPELQTGTDVSITKSHKYSSGNTYTIKVVVVDNLFWDGSTDLLSLLGQSYVRSQNHTLQSWTVLSGLQLSSQPDCHAVNTPVTFTVTFPTGYNKDSYTFNWNFNDGSQRSGYELDGPTHTFSNAGTFNVQLRIQNNDSKGTVTYRKCIEVPISGLAMSPKTTPLAITRGHSVTAGFDVSVTYGSDLQYLWLFDGKNSTKSPNAFTWDVNRNGTFSVKLKVYNHISSEETSTQFSVIETISGLKIDHNGFANNYFRINQVYDFIAGLETGSDLTNSWTVQSPGKEQNTQDYRNSISWPTAGSYSVSITVTNRVSVQTRTVTAVVQVPVSTLTIAAVPDVDVNTQVQLTATPDAGTALQYEWTVCFFGDDTCVKQSTTAPVLSTTPNKAGRYNYTVRAYNHVSSVTTSSIIRVWGGLSGLDIAADSVSNGWAIKGTDLTFRATLQDGEATTFTWAMNATNFLWNGTGESITINLSGEHRYDMTLVASNPIHSISAAYSFSVQEAIEGLTIHALQGDIANTGETLQFMLTYNKGSNIRYNWKLTQSDGTKVKDSRNDYLSFEFLTAGEYLLHLETSNKVSDIEKTLVIKIQDLDPKYSIKVHYSSDPYVHQDIPIECSAVGITENIQSYAWSIYDEYPPAQGQEERMGHTFAKRGHYIIEVRVEVNSRAEPIVIRKMVFVQGSLPPVTLAQDKKIIATGETVRFEATVHGTVEDLEYMWVVGTETLGVNKSNTLTYTFQTPGEIRVQVLARNKVSFNESSVYVTVQDVIEDIELANCCYYNASVNSPLRASVSKGTNVTYTWKMEFGSASLGVGVGSEIRFTFPTVGDYKVTITATNLVSSKVTTFDVHAQEPVSGLIWYKVPSQVYVGQRVNFTTSIQSGSHITYSYGIVHISTNMTTLTHSGQDSFFIVNFTKSGTFILKVTAFNNVSRKSAIKVITSFHIRCEPMKLSAIGGTSKSEIRSRVLELEVAVELDCTRYPVVYTWKVYRDCHTMEDEVQITGVTLNTPQLALPARTLDVGQYCAQFTAMYERTPVVISVTSTIDIRSSRMRAIIDGGSARSLFKDEVIFLNGNTSYDPDVGPGEPLGLSYSWTCQSTGRNCFEPQDTSEVYIPSGQLEADTNYTVTLCISKPGRQQECTTQQLKISSVAVPLACITCSSCIASNQFAISSGQPIKLMGCCDNCKGGSRVSYSWKVIRDDGLDVQLTSATSTTGSDQSSLVINQGSLDSDHAYTFQLTVSDAGHFGEKGYAELLMTPNQPPSGGRCYVGNLSVIALEESLEVVCENWTDPDDLSGGLIYQVFVERQDKTGSGDWYTLYKGSRTEGHYLLSPWTRSEEVVIVKVDVIDKLGGKTLGLNQEIRLRVEVPASMTRFEYLLDFIDRKLPVLVIRQAPKELLQFSIALMNQLNTGFEGGSADDINSRRLARTVVLKALKEMNFTKTLDDLQQLSYLLKQLTDVASEIPMTSDALYDLLGLVGEMLSWMSAHASTATNSEDVVPDNILSISTNIIEAVQSEINNPQPTPTPEPTTTPVPDTNRRKRSVENSTAPATEATIQTTTESSPPRWQREVMESSVDTLSSALFYLSLTKVPGEQMSEFKYKLMYITGQLVQREDMLTRFDLMDYSVLIKPGILDDLVGPDEPLFQCVMFMQSNPFQWGYDSTSEVTSEIMGIHFKHKDGREIKIENLSENNLIELIMPNTASLNDINGGEITSLNASSLFNPGASLKTQFNTSTFASGAVNIEISGYIVPGGNETDDDVAEMLALTAYIGYGYEPFWYKYSEKLTIDSNSSSSHEQYTFFVPIDADTADIIYVTVTNNNPDHQVNVTITPYQVQCEFYSPTASGWSTAGVAATARSNRTHTVCLSNHLTIFGASSLVSPGDIDFSDLTRLNLTENPVVLILVSVIAGVFIVVVFWARQYDLQDLHNISIVPLCGRDGLFKYEVVVVTGRKRGAGTSSHVGIKLYGEEGKSGARHLSRLGAFGRNSEDSFLIATDGPLGILHKVHVWHDNTGKHPSWYVSRVVVRDLMSNRKYYFLVNSWLSLTMEKGTLDKQVYAACPEELSNFGTVFHTETSRGFAERHVWLSVWDRPPRSRFTRVQRVVCCTTLLYSFMCANVMWYGLINQTKRETQALGLVSINWQDFVVGILASIIVFPINFAIIQIFRFSKVKVNAYDYGFKPGTAQTIEVEAMCDMSQAGDSFIAYDRKNSIQRLRRESSTDSILVPPKIHRFGQRQIAPKRVGGGTSSNAKCEAPSSSSPRQDDYKQVPIESKKWWSYDTILKWPEKMPSDGRVESANPGPLRKRHALRSINTPREVESEELIIDDDTMKNDKTVLRNNRNKNKGIFVTSTSGTLSISQSIREIEEDPELEEPRPDCSKKYESIPLTPLLVPVQTSDYGSAEPGTSSISSGVSGGDHSTMTNDKKDPKLLSPSTFMPRGEPKLDSDSGEVNRALLEIESNIKESQQIEPRLLNKKKLSGNQGNTPHVDILRLDELDLDPSKDTVDDDLLDLAELEPKSRLRKTKSKTRVSKRWAQIVIPPECEQYKNDHFRIFDPDDEYDAVPLSRSGTLKSRERSLSRSTTSSSRFHQLMPSTTSRVRWLLPHWCVYLAYLFCFVVSGFSVIVTILYGHNFGRELALKWLLAFFISFLDSVFILEPLKVLALAVFVAMLTRGLHEEDEGIETTPLIESNEKIKDVRMKPLGGFALLQAREEGIKVQRMHRLLRHALVYFLFLWVAFFITYRAHNTALYPISTDVHRGLTAPITSNGTHFYNIQRPDELWSWLQQVAAPALYPDPGELTNTQRVLLGQARLRQIRGIPVECHARDVLLRLSANSIVDHGCYGEPGWREDTEHYTEDWTPSAGNATWRYYTPLQALGEGYDGEVGSYGGGGYVQDLGTTLQEAETKLTELANANWTDRRTRAVFLEANLYTVPAHLHTTIRILAEFPVTGGIWMSADIHTFQLQNHVPGQVTAIMVFLAFLSMIWVYLVFVVVMGLRRHGARYVLSLWHWLEVTVTILVLAVIISFIHRVVADTAAHSRYLTEPKAFNSFYESMSAFRAWKTLTGLMVFLLTAWTARMLRFIKPMSAFGRTFSAASPKLLGATFIFVLLVLGFSNLGHLFFGSAVSSFRSYGSSTLTVVGLIRARSMHVLGDMYDYSPQTAGFVLFTFIGSVLVATMGLFIAILNTTYRMVRLQTYYRTSMDMQDYEMVDFIMKRFKKYMGITKPKPAFRRVKFQGMPSISSRSSMSSRTGMSQSLVSSGSSDPFGLDALEEQTYLEELLDRCVPTWNRMLAKLERVLWLDREITRLEATIVEILGPFMLAKRRPAVMPRLLQLKRAAAGRVVGSRGSRCHRSNSESLMTDVRAKQIRDALTAELQEMEEKIIADVETTTRTAATAAPKMERRHKSSSFTEAQGQGKDQDLLEYEMAILGEAEAGIIHVAEGKPPPAPGASRPPLPPAAATKSPPPQPKRFLPSAGPRRTFHEAGSSGQTRESPSAVKRRGSGSSSARRRPPSPLPGPGVEEVRDAPVHSQRAYGTKLPRRDIKIPAIPKTNLTRRPTSEQSERVKKNPDLPLPKYES